MWFQIVQCVRRAVKLDTKPGARLGTLAGLLLKLVLDRDLRPCRCLCLDPPSPTSHPQEWLCQGSVSFTGPDCCVPCVGGFGCCALCPWSRVMSICRLQRQDRSSQAAASREGLFCSPSLHLSTPELFLTDGCLAFSLKKIPHPLWGAVCRTEPCNSKQMTECHHVYLYCPPPFWEEIKAHWFFFSVWGLYPDFYHF